MISKPVLRDLVSQRIRDANALFGKRRYHTSFYILGYAIEIALKYKICKMYFFSKGFPENNIELQQYYKQIKNKGVRSVILKIHELKIMIFQSCFFTLVKNLK